MLIISSRSNIENVTTFLLAPAFTIYWPLSEDWIWTQTYFAIFSISLWVTFFFTVSNWQTNLVIGFVLSINWKIKMGYFLCMSQPDGGSILFDSTYQCLTVPFKENWVAYLNLVYIIAVFIILRRFIHKTKTIQKIIQIKKENIVCYIAINAIVPLSIVALIAHYYLIVFKF